MGYAVYHLEKGSISSGGLGHHIDRTPGREYTYKHADPTLTKNNIVVKLHNDYHKMSLSDAIAHRIDEGYQSKKAIRKDAVKYITHILTGSHEEMLDIFSDEKKKRAWITANLEWVAQEFGAENIVRFVVHLDEKTPHIHAVTVPITRDGRLSAKSMISNKKSMQQRQDRYAEKMKIFGLKRGIRSTGIRHENARKYYARVKDGLAKAKVQNENLEVWEKKKGVLSLFSNEKKLNYTETLGRYKSENLSLKTALNEEIGKKNELLKLIRGNENLEKEREKSKKLEEMLYNAKIKNEREIGLLKREIKTLQNPSKEYLQQKLEEILEEERKAIALKREQELSNKILKNLVSSAIINAISESKQLGTRLTYDVLEFHFEELKRKFNIKENYSPMAVMNEIEKQLDEKEIDLRRNPRFRR